MIKQIIESIKSIEESIFQTMCLGFKLSIILLLIATLILFLHKITPLSHIFYDSGLILFKTGLTFAVFFFICGFVFDKLKKQII